MKSTERQMSCCIISKLKASSETNIPKSGIGSIGRLKASVTSP